MQIKISARHGHLSEATQEFIREKANKILHFFERLMMIEVTVDLHEQANVVEILVTAEHKHDFVAKETGADLLATVEVAVSKIESQVRKYKERIQDHHRNHNSGHKSEVPPSDDKTGD